MCETYLSGKTCRFGNRCWYSHGNRYLKSYDAHNRVYNLNEARNMAPTMAQKRWMMMSLQSEQHQAEAHQAILMGNRFSRESVKVQPRVTESRCGPTQNHRQVVKEPMKLTSLLELFKDEIPIRENSPMPFSFPDENNDHLSDEAVNLLHFPFIKSDNNENVCHEVCDIYAISGFCPLGDECLFEHRARFT